MRRRLDLAVFASLADKPAVMAVHPERMDHLKQCGDVASVDAGRLFSRRSGTASRRVSAGARRSFCEEEARIAGD